MEPHYFKDMLSALSRRSSNSTLSWLGFANVPLRRHLRDVFSRGYGDAGALLVIRHSRPFSDGSRRMPRWLISQGPYCPRTLWTR